MPTKDASETRANDSANTSGSNSKPSISVEAESTSKAKGNKKSKAWKKRRKKLKKTVRSFKALPMKARIVIVALAVAIILSIPAFIIPLLKSNAKTTYASVSSLEDIVNVNKLSTVDYLYKGVAIKNNSFDVAGNTLGEWVDYRVKYVAHIRASFDMSQIRFEQPNRKEKTFNVYIPEPSIEIAGIDENELGYLPENAHANLPEVLRLCREDAQREISEDAQIKERAYESLKSTITGLTLPALGSNEYTLEFIVETNQSAESDSATDDVSNDTTEDQQEEGVSDEN